MGELAGITESNSYTTFLVLMLQTKKLPQNIEGLGTECVC